MNSEALASAFAAFNRNAARLEREYRELKARVGELTRRLAAEQSARHRELLARERLADRLSRMFDLLPGAVLVIDGAGIVREHNAKALELLDRPLTGCPWSEIARREFCPGESADGELRLRDGRWLSLSRRPLAQEPGEILLLSDVTESRRTRQLLGRHRRLSGLGEMSARLAHQLRTPLAAALLHACNLEKHGAPRARTAAAKLVTRLKDLSRMIDDMLRYSGGARAAEERFAAGPMLREVVDGLAHAATDARELDWRCADPSLVLTGNRESLKGALVNLASNALQACGASGRVEVSAERLGERVFLAVRDDGPGLSGEARARLFEPFFTTRAAGTGLGLAVVRSVAEAHGGQVVWHSVPGATVFAICLSAGANEGEASGEPAAAAPDAVLAEACHG